MILHIKLLNESARSTVSTLYVDGQYFCYVLEDGFNMPKIMRETRIPHGLYEIEPRKDGRHYLRYSQKFNHKFSIWMRHIPNYLWVMIHIGNFYQDTYGCPLLGKKYSQYRGDYAVWDSTEAYRDLYEKLLPLFVEDENGFRFTERVLIAVDRSGSDYEKREPINTDRILTSR